MKLSHEFAGIGGDASFYKAQSETVISRRVASNAVRNLFHPSFCGRSLPPFLLVLVLFNSGRGPVEFTASYLLL